MSIRFLRLLCLSLLVSAAACHHRSKNMSFYYWRSSWTLDSLERQTLDDNGVKTLYVRYFDIDRLPDDTIPQPVAPIRSDPNAGPYVIIPVVFIRNRVFEKTPPGALPELVDKVQALVRRINASASVQPRSLPSTRGQARSVPFDRVHPGAIQFDCDWTERTKDAYFAFLRQYRQASGAIVSATIRLHQVKYPDRTGIPPVDHGVLMFYNMGNIDAGGGSSIYDRSIAHQYTPWLRSYPLPLDLALPIFSWSLQIREGRVIQLLDKMNAASFAGDSNFVRTPPTRFTVRQAGFRHGYYFQAGDVIKPESISPDDLLEIVSEVNRHSNHRIGDVIFFDLDSQNLRQYDKHLFTEILDHTD